MLVSGPAPVGILERSLAVHNLPVGRCSYACVHCDHAGGMARGVRRRAFFPVRTVVRAVEDRLRRCEADGRGVDRIVIAPDGEPTLDVRLGPLLRLLRPLGLPIAVVTNGSLLWQPAVRAELQHADLVSVRVDAVETGPWRRVNRPVRQLRPGRVLEGLETFARGFGGELWTETTLVRGLIDDPDALLQLEAFLAVLGPSRALTAVTRSGAAPERGGRATKAPSRSNDRAHLNGGGR